MSVSNSRNGAGEDPGNPSGGGAERPASEPSCHEPPPPLPWEARSRVFAWGYAPPSPIVVRSMVYVWGYGKPVKVILQSRFEETEEASLFAAERGWDARRAGAWTGQMTLPLDLWDARRMLEPVLRLDPAILGWGGREVAADEQTGSRR